MRSILRYSLGLGKKGIFVFLVYGIAITLLLKLWQPSTALQSKPQKDANASVYATIKDLKKQNTPESKIRLAGYQSTTCSLAGVACTNNPADDEKNFQSSFFGKASSVVMSPLMYPPASGLAWTRDSLAEAGFIPDTYAAEGIGFAALRPFNELWKIFRNISYTIMVLIIITLGFMVMFRRQLDGQTVISVENSLPRIVLSLLFITFSFPIAGFMIDLMYILIGLGVSVLAPTDPQLTESQHLNNFFGANFGTLWTSVFISEGNWVSNIPIAGPIWDLTRLGNALVGVLPSFLNDAVKFSAFMLWIAPAMHGSNFIFGPAFTLFDNIDFLGNSIGTLPSSTIKLFANVGIFAILLPILIFNGAGFIVGILMLLTILFLMFRIFFMLFMGYIRIILYVIFAPILLLLDAIPGQNFFATWLRNLAGELLMFPIVIYLLMVGKGVTNIYTGSAGPSSNVGWGAVGYSWQPPFLYGIAPEHFAILIGMGIMFLIPDLVKLVKEAMGIKGLPIKVGVNTYLAGASTVVGGAAGLVPQIAALKGSLLGQESTNKGLLSDAKKLFGFGGP